MGSGCSSAKSADSVMHFAHEEKIKRSPPAVAEKTMGPSALAGTSTDGGEGRFPPLSKENEEVMCRWELLGEIRSAREQFDRERDEQEGQMRADLSALELLADNSRNISSNDSERKHPPTGEAQSQPANRDELVLESRFGIRAKCLQDLVKRFGREKLADLTSKEFAEQCIKPSTAASQNSYVQDLYDDSQQRNKVGIAQIAVSHASDCKVLDLFDAVADFLERDRDVIGEDNPVLWLDFLSRSLHRPRLTDRAELSLCWDAIAKMRKLVVILTPFDQPLALNRAWVMFEALACVANRGELVVGFPPRERDGLLEQMKEDPMFFGKVAAKARTGLCECRCPVERNAVFSEIARRGYPFWQVDKMVLGALTAAGCDMVKEETNREGDAVQRGRLLAALGDILLQVGKGEEAREELEEAVEVLAEAEGSQGAHTLKARTSLCVAHGGDAAQLRALQEEVEASRATHGELHQRTLTARNNIAQALSDLGLHEQALEEHQAVCKGMRAVLGKEHPCTLACMHNAGTVQYHLQQYAAAEATLRDCLRRRRRVHGGRHSNTALTMFWLGVVLEAQRRLPAAVPMFAESHGVFALTLGDAHRHTRDAKSWLSSVQWGIAEVI